MELLKNSTLLDNIGLRQKFPWSARHFGDVKPKVSNNISSREEQFLWTLLGNQISDIRDRFVARVENPHLWAQYALRYEEMRADPLSSNVVEHIMIHATSFSAAYEIAENNFDWRLVRRHRFGQGVSFAKNVDYAAKQATQKGTYVVAGILVSNNTVGIGTTHIPPRHYDTTTNAAKSVYVKYYDSDFYPYYIVD